MGAFNTVRYSHLKWTPQATENKVLLKQQLGVGMKYQELFKSYSVASTYLPESNSAGSTWHFLLSGVLVLQGGQVNGYT